MSVPPIVRILALVAITLSSGVARAATTPATQPARVLHITADPNNLPFSNDKREGFENKIADVIAKDLGATIEYDWRAQRRGYVREAIKHGTSEITMGVPTKIERVMTTRPYYRSTYCFVYRKDAKLKIDNFDSPALKQVKIAVPLTGGTNNSPPGQALANRGIIDNIVGFSLYSEDYREPNPIGKIISAVADGKVDVAIAWGPVAGYFAQQQKVPLVVVPITQPAESSTPFAYDISVGVKRGNKALRDEIDGALSRHKEDISRILDEYHVPRVTSDTQSASGSEPSHAKASGTP
jgi:quinoprotein dehydrogenase-associated probable ABC transporter substrate-binding protein